MSSSRESLKVSTSDLSDISEDLVAFHLSEDLAFEELLEEKKRRFRVKRYALPPMDQRKDYHK